MIWLWTVLLAAAPAQNKQMEMNIKSLLDESIPAGMAYSRMSQEGVNAASWSELGDLYMSISKPVQARFCYEKASKLEPKKDAIASSFKKAEERIKTLEGKIAEYEKSFQEKGEYRKKLSKAAVLYHLGREEKALTVLKGMNPDQMQEREVRALEYTFQMGLVTQARVLQALDQQFEEAIKASDLETALSCLGRMNFTSLGRFELKGHVDRLVKAFPDKLKQNILSEILTLPVS